MKREYYYTKSGTYMVKESCQNCGKLHHRHKVGKRPKMVLIRPDYCPECETKISETVVWY